MKAWRGCRGQGPGISGKVACVKLFVRYSKMFECDLREACAVAHKAGMKIIAGFKPGMCCWWSIALAGTPTQMKAVDAEWRKRGADPSSRRPSGAWEIDSNVPEDEWISGSPAEFAKFIRNAERDGKRRRKRSKR